MFSEMSRSRGPRGHGGLPAVQKYFPVTVCGDPGAWHVSTGWFPAFGKIQHGGQQWNVVVVLTPPQLKSV